MIRPSPIQPILVGLFNPYSTLPEQALVPVPATSSGARLRNMLAAVHTDYGRNYRTIFDRHNLARIESETRNSLVLRERAAAIADGAPAGSTLVLLGDQVRAAFHTPDRPIRKVFLHPQAGGPITFRVIPHPSGRSTIYNHAINRLLVGMMLKDLCDEWAVGPGRYA